MKVFDRREFARLSTLAALGALWPLPSKADSKVKTPCVVDSSVSVARTAKALADKGIRAVFRYYALAEQPGLPSKRITPLERDSIFEAGLSLGLAYQYFNNKLSTFTADRGRADADCVLKNASNLIKQPAGSAVYFGVDGDWPDNDSTKRIITYFEALNERLSNGDLKLKIGVYGSGHTCALLRKRQLASCFWIAKSIGFSGTRDFYNSQEWHMYQNMLEVNYDDAVVDTNLCNGSRPALGIFNQNGISQIDPDPSIMLHRRFVKPNRLAVTTRPSTLAKAIYILHRDDNVVDLGQFGGWTKVAIGEGDEAVGYCRTGDLSSILTMP